MIKPVTVHQKMNHLKPAFVWMRAVSPLWVLGENKPLAAVTVLCVVFICARALNQHDRFRTRKHIWDTTVQVLKLSTQSLNVKDLVFNLNIFTVTSTATAALRATTFSHPWKTTIYNVMCVWFVREYFHNHLSLLRLTPFNKMQYIGLEAVQLHHNKI